MKKNKISAVEQIDKDLEVNDVARNNYLEGRISVTLDSVYTKKFFTSNLCYWKHIGLKYPNVVNSFFEDFCEDNGLTKEVTDGLFASPEDFLFFDTYNDKETPEVFVKYFQETQKYDLENKTKMSFRELGDRTHLGGFVSRNEKYSEKLKAQVFTSVIQFPSIFGNEIGGNKYMVNFIPLKEDIYNTQYVLNEYFPKLPKVFDELLDKQGHEIMNYNKTKEYQNITDVENLVNAVANALNDLGHNVLNPYEDKDKNWTIKNKNISFNEYRKALSKVNNANKIITQRITKTENWDSTWVNTHVHEPMKKVRENL